MCLFYTVQWQCGMKFVLGGNLTAFGLQSTLYVGPCPGCLPEPVVNNSCRSYVFSLAVCPYDTGIMDSQARPTKPSAQPAFQFHMPAFSNGSAKNHGAN